MLLAYAEFDYAYYHCCASSISELLALEPLIVLTFVVVALNLLSDKNEQFNATY